MVQQSGRNFKNQFGGAMSGRQDSMQMGRNFDLQAMKKQQDLVL
jgi:hypothetical protein